MYIIKKYLKLTLFLILIILSSSPEIKAQIISAPTLSSPADGSVNLPTTITFKWNAVSGASAYHLQVSTDGSFNNLVVDNTGISGTSQQISGLSQETTYYWRVNASTLVFVSGWSSTWSFTTLTNTLVAPTLLSPSNGAADQPVNITFSWNSVQNATGYHFQLSTSSSFSAPVADRAALTSTSTTVNSLAEGQTYYWRVSADNPANTGPWSAVWSFTILTSTNNLTAPNLIYPADKAVNLPTTITFKWDSVKDATSYQFQLSSLPSFDSLIKDDSNLARTSNTVSSLSNSKTYYWRANAANSQNSGPWSNSKSFSTNAPLDPPTLISPADNSAGQPTDLVFRWNPSANASQYHIQVSTDGSFSNMVVDQGGITNASYQVNGLKTGTTYYWHVNASSLLLTSSWSSTWQFTTTSQSLPLAPVLLSPQNGAVNQAINVMLNWNPSQGADTYHLQLSGSSTFDILIMNDSSLTGTSDQAANLKSGTKYYWRVSARNTAGMSGWSEVWTFQTTSSSMGIPALISPSDGSIDNPTSLNLAWSSVNNANFYNLQLSKDSQFTTFEINADSLVDTLKNVDSLETGTDYFWRVRASFSTGYGAWSNTSSFRTFDSGLPAPILISPQNDTTNETLYPILSWNNVKSADHYRLEVSNISGFSTTVFDDSTITATYTQIGPLDASTKYFWRVKAFNSTATGGWSETWHFTTQSASEYVPLLVSPADGSKNNPLSVLCDWDSVAGATMYNIRVSTTPNFTSIVINDSSVIKTSKVINNLSAATTYFWQVRAKRDNTWGQFSPAWGFSTVVSEPTYVNIKTNIDFPTYSDISKFKSTDYKLVGIPGISEIPITAFLTGNPDKDWIAYEDNGDSKNYLVKYNGKTDFVFSAGHAFWILKNGPLSIDTTVQEEPVSSESVELPIQPGWNLITNPLLKKIVWKDVQSLNSITEPVYSFKSTYQKSDFLTPFMGYYFFNSTGLQTLKIPVNDTTLVKLRKNTSTENESLIWELNISLTSGNFTDSTAWIGISGNVTTQFNRFDVHKPHSIGSAPYLFFSHPEWDSNYSAFASDIRPEFDDIAEWTITATSFQSENATLKFEGISKIPSNYEIYLINKDSGTKIDLRKENTYSYITEKPQKTFKIIVGKESAINRKLNDVPIPQSFELGNNYPNPFNNSTIFNVYLPEKSDIEVTVYNVIGNYVKTIYKGEMPAGKHTLRWSGDDNHDQAVSSGVYLYRITTGSGINLIKKMILLK